MRIGLRFPALLILLAACVNADPPSGAAREYSRRIWRVEDGLPQNRIQAITQTPDGYLWVGTSEGLARFDGVRFTVFGRSNVPDFHDDSILQLLTSRDGSLWIGTEGGGLVHYQNGSFRAFGDQEGLTNGFIRAIFEDSAGMLWVGADRGLFRMAGQRFERMDGTKEIPLASVVSILADQNHKLWISSSVGLLTLENGKLRSIRCEGAPMITPKVLHQSSGGAFRIINDFGASLIRNGCSVPDPSIPNLAVTLLHEDRSGNLWAGTVAQGLLRFSAGTMAKFQAPSTLPDNHITAFFEDQQDNIWIGGSDGLLRLRKTAISMLGIKDGLVDDDVATVYEDREKRLWIATISGELYRLTKGVPVRFHLPALGDNIAARTVFEDSKGAFWFGTASQGLVRLWHGKSVVYSTKDGLRSNNIRQVHEDHSGMIWIATGSGLSRWDGRVFKNYYLEDGLSYPSVRCIATKRNGDLLIGTDGGLDLIHQGLITQDPLFAQIGKEKIWAIHEDDHGAVWLGTRGSGLIRVKSGKVSRITTREGLPGNSIYQIVEDSHRKFWLSSPIGIFSADRGELDRLADGETGAIHVVTHGPFEGMETSQMSGGLQSAGCRTSSGEIWFPSIKGVVRINPDQPAPKRSMPVLIERAVSGDRPLPLSGDISIVQGDGRLAIDFTICNLAFPQSEVFRYKLDGFEANWNPATRARTAYYTNVPPGRYRFRVQASDVGAPLETSEASLQFVFQPAFHQTGWFYAICILVVGGCVWGAFGLHNRQTSARYALLLSERTRLAREMHDTVIQGCVGVSTLLEASSRFQRLNLEESNKLLDQARIEVKATIEEARQAVWNLRHMSEENSSISALFELARRLGIEHTIVTETETIGERVPLDLTTDHTLLLVGREALRNAVSHAQAARMTIRLIFSPPEVKLEVEDDGTGFDPASSLEESGHFGIIGMRERVEQAGGSFGIVSAPGQGTLVGISMPLRRRPDGG